MKIDITPKLDFNNVLIKPKRTTINSRSEVNLEREFVFPHSKVSWTGIPELLSTLLLKVFTGSIGIFFGIYLIKFYFFKRFNIYF